jgi:hypothetical protein
LDSRLIVKIGLSGGIVQVSASCKNNELQNGMGVTVYHFVESIDEVCFISLSFLREVLGVVKEANRKRSRSELRVWVD